MRTSRFFNVRRVRGLVAALALGGVVTVAAPVAASAYQGYGATLQPNTAACVQQYATTQVRGEGTATRQGAFFTLRYSGQYPGLGAAIATSQVGTTSGWAAESRPWLGNFPGPGYYQVCAANTNARSTLVNIRILVDGDFA